MTNPKLQECAERIADTAFPRLIDFHKREELMKAIPPILQQFEREVREDERKTCQAIQQL